MYGHFDPRRGWDLWRWNVAGVEAEGGGIHLWEYRRERRWLRKGTSIGAIFKNKKFNLQGFVKYAGPTLLLYLKCRIIKCNKLQHCQQRVSQIHIKCSTATLCKCDKRLSNRTVSWQIFVYNGLSKERIPYIMNKIYNYSIGRGIYVSGIGMALGSWNCPEV
jgi:hypothetical protein